MSAQTCFHGTSESKLDHIRQNGLVAVSDASGRSISITELAFAYVRSGHSGREHLVDLSMHVHCAAGPRDFGRI
jgi:hypothetical protein